MGTTMGTGNVHDDDVETLQFADESDWLTPEEIHDSEDTGLTAGAVLNERYREETPRERRERHAEERDEERRFRTEYGEPL